MEMKLYMAFLIAIITSTVIDSTLVCCKEKQAGNQEKVKKTRLSEFFVIKERATKNKEDKSSNQSMYIKEGDIINAFSIIDLMFRNTNAIDSIFNRYHNVLITIDLKKAGEDTWSHISVNSRWNKLAQRSTNYGKTGLQSGAASIRPFYVLDETLDANQYLREGESVVVLYTFDVTSQQRNIEALRHDANKNLPLLSVNLQELYLNETGSVPVKYTAQQGDELRIRILKAVYEPNRQKDLLTFKGMKKEKQKLVKEVSKRVTKTNDKDVLKAIDLFEDQKAEDKEFIRILQTFEEYSDEAILLDYLIKNKIHIYDLYIADIVTEGDEMHYTIKEFGYKIEIAPVIAYGTQTKKDRPNRDELNPIKTTASIGSNIYLFTYDGRSAWKNVLNWLPGVHISLLGLKEPYGTAFTLGIVHPLWTKYRGVFGVFLAWHDLKQPVMGLTFSPKVNFRKMVGAEKTE